MKLLFTAKWMVFIVVLLQCGRALPGLTHTWSSVGISTCNAPTTDEPFSLCCITKNVPSLASIFFYKMVSNVKEHIIRIDSSCDILYPGTEYIDWTVECSKDGNYSITRKGSTWDEMFRTWGCGYYGNSSSFTITKQDVLTRHQGYMLQHEGDSPVLSWLLSGVFDLVQISNALHRRILEIEHQSITFRDASIDFVGNITAGNISIRLKDIDRSSNGTYVCVYKDEPNAAVSVGLTVVVLEKPKIPVINITASSGSEGTAVCSSVSQSAAPLYYVPQLQFDWLVPGQDVTYNTTANKSTLYISQINCQHTPSLPVYCTAKEGNVMSFDSQPFFPHSICESQKQEPPPEYDSRITSLVLSLSIFVVVSVFTMTISMVIGRDFVKRKLRRFCKMCCKLSSCCRTGLETSSSDSDSDIDSILRMSARDRRNNHSYSDRPVIHDFERDNQGLHDALGPREDDEIQRAIDRIAIEENRDANAMEMSRSLSSLDNSELGAVSAPQAVPPPIDEHAELDEVERLLELHQQHLGRDVNNLNVARDNILENVLQYYTDPTVATSRVTVKFIGEDGMDCGGVTDDMYTTFWYRAEEQFFLGSEAVVPHMKPHMLTKEESTFLKLGRILSHSLAILRAFPIPMCKSAVIGMIYNTTNVAKETLIEDFLLFLDPIDRALVSSAINDFSALTSNQTEDLQNIFIQHNYSGVVNAENFIEHLTLLARNLICIQPKPLLDIMRQGIPQNHFDYFWSRLHLNSLNVLFRALKPTAPRVISRLKTEQRGTDLSRRQRAAFGYLQNLLREMSVPELETFLQFVTGKKSTPRQLIMVTFTDDVGLRRLPKAHTCSSLLELPETYEDYDTFRSEFKHVLASDEALTMTMA